MKELSPTVYSGSAVAVGFAICENMSVNEQIIIGNWLMLLGQFITTYSSLAGINQSNEDALDQKQKEDDFENLKKALQNIQDELGKLKPQEK